MPISCMGDHSCFFTFTYMIPIDYKISKFFLILVYKFIAPCILNN